MRVVDSTPAPGGRRRFQTGFTVVEVIVALTLMSILMAGGTTIIASSDRSQAKSKARNKQTAAAEAIFERLHASHTWATNAACATAPYTGCSSYLTDLYASDPMLTDEASGLKLSLQITADATDSPSDGKDVDDEDGVLPDYYRVSVKVKPTDTFASLKPATTGGVINPPARVSTGAIEVRMCRAYPQVDERIAIASCGTGSADQLKLQAPTNCTATYDCYAYSRAATDNPAYTSMSLAPATGQSFSLLGPLPETTVAKTGVTDSNGHAKAVGLQPGQYRLQVTPPAGYRTWASHSVPTAGVATVEAGKSNHLLQVFQPEAAGNYRVHARTRITTDPWNVYTVPYSLKRIVFRLIPVPYGRVSFGRWTTIPAGQGYADVQRPAPGLYAMSVIRSPGARISNMVPAYGASTGYLWINRAGGSLATAPGQSVIQRDHCDPAGRQGLINAYCHAAPRCWYNRGGVTKYLTPCGAETTPDSGTIGDGGA